MQNFIFLLVILLILLYFLVYRANFLPKKSLLSKNKLKVVFIAYCLVLLTSTAVVYALPETDFVQSAKSENQDQISKAQQAEAMFYDLASRGLVDKIDGIYKNASFTYELEENKLEIEVFHNLENWNHHRIWIEKKHSNDGKVEVFSFISPHIINNIDFTDKVIPPEIKFVGDRITIFPQEKLEIRYSRFDQDFTSKQFLDSASIPYSNVTIFGMQAIYVRIPNNVEVIVDDELNVMYVQS